MSKTLTVSILFQYLVDEDELMAEMTEQEQIEYVKETTFEDIMTMGYGSSEDLYSAMEVKVN
jgi:hypothetical protein